MDGAVFELWEIFHYHGRQCGSVLFKTTISNRKILLILYDSDY